VTVATDIDIDAAWAKIVAYAEEGVEREPGVLYGNTAPRVFTPPLRELHPGNSFEKATSLGFEAIRLGEKVLKLKLNPWQKLFLISALELREDGNLRFRTVLLMVARQNGKTTVVNLMTIWRLFVDEAQLIIGTAQNLDVAESTWEEVLGMIEESTALSKELGKVSRTNGRKFFRIRPKGKRPREYKIQTASRSGGRSLSADMVFLDELREHFNYEAWNAITKTMMAKKRAQNICASNAGDKFSIVLNEQRKRAHGRLGDPDGLYQEGESLPGGDDTSFGIFEWSAKPGRDIWDRKGWQEANPSLGFTVFEEAISSAAASDPEAGFRTEVLCQKVDLLHVSPFGSQEVWEAGIDPASAISKTSRFTYAFDMSRDRSRVFIARAGYREDGNVHVEIRISRPGTGWVKNWLKVENVMPDGTVVPARKDNPLLAGIAVQTSSAAAALLTSGDFDDLNVNVMEWGGADLHKGTGAFYDLVQNTFRGTEKDDSKVDDEFDATLDGDATKVFHREQAVLDRPAAYAKKKRMGNTGFAWDAVDSPVEVAPLNAATAAVWALMSLREEVKSAYAQGYWDDEDDVDEHEEY
jgi:hypothetical protein